MSVLLALVVTVPLVGAVLPLVVGRRTRLSRLLTGGILVVQVGLAVAVAAVVARRGPVSSVVGGLPSEVGIGLVADAVTSAFLLLVACTAVAFFAIVRTDSTRFGDSLWLLLVAGLSGVTVTADVFNLYVFLEISGLAAYALVATGRGAPAALAAFRYLLVGTVGATLYLLGVGYLYVATGTLSMAGLNAALSAIGYDSPLVIASFVLIAVGLGVKIALFPLHTWKPAAYATSPADVSALLATLVSTIAGYALVRLTFGVYTLGFLTDVPAARVGLLVAGAVSVVAGGVLTLRQTDIRRLLAYSSVLQFGLIVVAIGLATPAAVTGALVLLLSHAIAKGGLFASVGILAREFDVKTVADYTGLVRDAPLFTVAASVVFASLVGLPPTAGFAGKWYVALGAVAAESWTIAALVVGSTLLSILYVGRVVETMVFGTPTAGVLGRGGSETGGQSHVSTDGGQLHTQSLTRASLLLAAVGGVVVALGLWSSDLALWFQPVVEGWL
ncbi:MULTISPECIES: complex I subunit 5 family protein [Haloferax]|uniref:Monovalent cation/H+ antiporter subunit D family protein n=1 Tax=Haloferax marinum TaxID=2666143 RepID=A0A6A8G827_9EURY|nr:MULTISPECIES: proton-conducting transporter membrane subunit [Haloferax]KAB1197853.1 monovalent cation/H+ antiporter subunit D family protein [Haloferax sp. CBA1150]MRW96915.1 monovalent cation/H+ antiporter subunit D family protein [Haloferax marinum]